MPRASEEMESDFDECISASTGTEESTSLRDGTAELREGCGLWTITPKVLLGQGGVRKRKKSVEVVCCSSQRHLWMRLSLQSSACQSAK